MLWNHISKFAECFPVKATDIDGIVDLAKKLSVDMVVVAPDDPPVSYTHLDVYKRQHLFSPISLSAQIP